MDLKDKLAAFTGTENYWKWSPLFPRMFATDGVRFLAEQAGAYWLLDAIASHQPAIIRHRDRRLREMQFWNLKVKDGGAKLTCVADSGEKPAIVQEIDFTDFPLPEIDLWVQPDGQGNMVVMLKSEY